MLFVFELLLLFTAAAKADVAVGTAPPVALLLEQQQQTLLTQEDVVRMGTPPPAPPLTLPDAATRRKQAKAKAKPKAGRGRGGGHGPMGRRGPGMPRAPPRKAGGTGVSMLRSGWFRVFLILLICVLIYSVIYAVWSSGGVTKKGRQIMSRKRTEREFHSNPITPPAKLSKVSSLLNFGKLTHKD